LVRRVRDRTYHQPSILTLRAFKFEAQHESASLQRLAAKRQRTAALQNLAERFSRARLLRRSLCRSAP
jgi:hypothetical protein